MKATTRGEAARKTIAVQGARVHNLKHVSVKMPRDAPIVVTGLSGSGKSSLAFDTIYAEGQRRYMASLSSYAKRFVAQVAKPDVDFVFGLSPVISIEQKTLSNNALRAATDDAAGEAESRGGGSAPAAEMDAIVDRVVVGRSHEKAIKAAIAAALLIGDGLVQIRVVTGAGKPAADRFYADTCSATHRLVYGDIGPPYFQFNNPESACRTCGGLGVDKLTHPDLLVPDPDRSILGGCFVREAFKYNPDTWDGRLMFSLSTMLDFPLDSPWRLLSDDVRHAILYGIGATKIRLMSPPDAKALRHGQDGREVEVALRGKTIDDILNMSVEEGVGFFAAEPAIGRKIQVLVDLGLGYLTLGQSATTLSGGEAQRIKIATELSTLQRAKHTVYILDEPTTGLHLADIERLLGSLHKLVDAGHTVILIEHHLDVIKVADHVIDLGPDGGHAGGEVVATGTPEAIARCRTSHTGRFLKAHLAT